MVPKMTKYETNLLSVKRIVIKHPVGGLGDCLSLSTLPEMFARHGIDSYIHSSQRYNNEEVQNLVWKSNPYVKGVTDEPPNAGGCRDIGARMPDGKLVRCVEDLTLGFISRIEVRHDLLATNRYPSVYYAPRIIPRLRNIVIVDVGSISMASNIPAMLEYLDFVVSHYNYIGDNMRQVQFIQKVANNNLMLLTNVEQYTINSLEHYCDVLFSCHALITTHSGAHSLAIALRRDRPGPTIHCFCPYDQFNRGQFIYDNVRYYTYPI